MENKIKIFYTLMTISWEVFAFIMVVLLGLIGWAFKMLWSSLTDRVQKAENRSEEIVKNYNVKLDKIEDNITNLSNFMRDSISNHTAVVNQTFQDIILMVAELKNQKK